MKVEELLPLLKLSDIIDDLLDLDIDNRIMYCFAVSQEIAKKKSQSYTTSAVKKSGERLSILLDRNSFLIERPNKVIYKKLFMSNGKSNLQITSELPNEIEEFFN